MVLDANMYPPILLQKSKHKNSLLLLISLFVVIALSTIAIMIVFRHEGKIFVTLCYFLKERKRAPTIAIIIAGRVIHILGAIQKRSHEPMYKTITENEAKRLSAITQIPMVLDPNVSAPKI